MFVHNFKYSLKILFKNKGLLFWTFIFPIILGTLFNLAFSNIEKTETFNKIDVAITPNNNSYIKSTFKVLEKENVVKIQSIILLDKYFHIIWCNRCPNKRIFKFCF